MFYVAPHKVYPPGPKIFNAFQHTPFEQLKVVIIGQDPYHGAGQAHGLCFSVPDGVKPPPSLVNIFKEIYSDINIPPPSNGNLERWADQGVFLLNATLTVRANQAGSHQNKGWEKFTDTVIETISKQKENVVNGNSGCLGGFLKLILLGWLFDWLQDTFGFGRGCSCTGCGCGCILWILFIVFACSIVTGTSWFQFGF